MAFEDDLDLQDVITSNVLAVAEDLNERLGAVTPKWVSAGVVLKANEPRYWGYKGDVAYRFVDIEPVLRVYGARGQVFNAVLDANDEQDQRLVGALQDAVNAYAMSRGVFDSGVDTDGRAVAAVTFLRSGLRIDPGEVRCTIKTNEEADQWLRAEGEELDKMLRFDVWTATNPTVSRVSF